MTFFQNGHCLLTINKGLHDVFDLHLFASFKSIIVLGRLDFDELELRKHTGMDKRQGYQSDSNNRFEKHGGEKVKKKGIKSQSCSTLYYDQWIR